MRNHKKSINEDDLSNPIKTYQTSFQHLKYDIERYREQRIKHECFQVLHPWAYDLDAVDMKYIVNNNLESEICKALDRSVDAQVFWLSFFKPQLSCSADEFFEAIRQLAEMCNLPGYFAAHIQQFENDMAACKYVVSVELHPQMICDTVDKLIHSTMTNVLQNMLKTYAGDTIPESSYVDVNDLNARFPAVKGNYFSDGVLGNMRLKSVEPYGSCDLQRKILHVKSDAIPRQRLLLKFEAVDTDELKNIEIAVEGDKAIFKIGEGETADYHIPNDKKLWETQFMVCSVNGQFFLRDMGFVHNSRVKLDQKCEVQVQKGSVVDLGKVVHYHFDKVVHAI